jgi:serine/threonine protein kinase
LCNALPTPIIVQPFVSLTTCDWLDYEFFERRGRKRTSNIWKVTEIATKKQYIVKKHPLPLYNPKPSPENHQSSEKNNISSTLSNDPNRQFEMDDENDLKSEFERNFQFYSAFREPFLLMSFNHPNIIKPIGFIRESDSLYHMYLYYLFYFVLFCFVSFVFIIFFYFSFQYMISFYLTLLLLQTSLLSLRFGLCN